MEWISQPETWIAFITLVVLELVLGVDNVIFISILAGKLPVADQQRARTTGILLAVITRLLLLFSLSWIIKLENPFFSLFGLDFSGRDLILLTGGVFLIWKATHEIHEKLEVVEDRRRRRFKPCSGVLSFKSCSSMLYFHWTLSSRLSAWWMSWPSWLPRSLLRR